MHIRTNPENSPRPAQLHKPEVYESLFIWWVLSFLCRLAFSISHENSTNLKNGFQEYCKTNTYRKKNFACKIGTSGPSTLPVYFNLHGWGQSTDLRTFAGVPMNANLCLPILCWEKKHTHTKKVLHKKLYLTLFTVCISFLLPWIILNPSRSIQWDDEPQSGICTNLSCSQDPQCPYPWT